MLTYVADKKKQNKKQALMLTQREAAVCAAAEARVCSTRSQSDDNFPR